MAQADAVSNIPAAIPATAPPQRGPVRQRRRPAPISEALLRSRIERAVERLIAALDRLDAPAEDLEEDGSERDQDDPAEEDDPGEDGGDAEPSLGALNCGTTFEVIARDADGYALATAVRHEDQTRWAWGGDRDLEGDPAETGIGDTDGLAEQTGAAE